MSNNTHDYITGQLSDYLDDELPASERREVDAHLAQCTACRTVLEDLRRIIHAARALPDAPPDRELWSGVAERIDATATNVTAFPPRTRRSFSFTVPQLAAAGIALMLLSGGVVYFARPQTDRTEVAMTQPDAVPATDAVPVSLADPQYDGAVSDLERRLEAGRGALDPETVRVLEQNLRAIDMAIDQSRRALEGDPANAYLTNHLVSARQRKIALLRRATALTTGS